MFRGDKEKKVEQTDGVTIGQIDGVRVDQVQDESVDKGSAGSPPAPSDSEESETESDLDELLIETSKPEFHYNVLQLAGQHLHDIASAASVATAISPFLRLTYPYNYLFATAAYKLGCDGIEGFRALTTKSYPLDGLRASGNGSLCHGAAKTSTFKAVSFTFAVTTGLIAVRFIGSDTDSPNNNYNSSPSIHDEAAKVPLVGLTAVVLAKTAETGMNAISNYVSDTVSAELERNPELSKWQVLGGYVVKGLRITAAGSTIFLYEIYAGDMRTALNHDMQTMETLAAILFFQAWEDLSFVPRPLSCLKVKKQHSLSNDNRQLAYVPMTNGEIARMVGINTLKESCSLGIAYGVARICCSFLLPAMNEGEMFAPQQNEMAAYVEQLLLAGITTASYFGAKFAAKFLPSIIPCATRVSGLWSSMWSRPVIEARVPLLEDVEAAATPALGGRQN